MMNSKYWFVLGLAVVAAMPSAACSSSSHSCSETRSCVSAEAGAGGDSSTASAAADSQAGAAPVAEAGSAGEAGAATNAGPALFGACSKLAAVACQGIASAERLACDGHAWQSGTTCAHGQLCDSTTGECATPVTECVSAAPGATVCRADKLLTCGVDLVSATERDECPGVCEAGACQAPRCGDLKVEADEDCDDGSSNDSGACVKCKKATCGDGSLYVGVEECDDGNLVAGDGCSPSCAFEPIAVSAGDFSTCALSKGGTVKCWGDNSLGELGIGNQINHGDGTAAMGKDLPVVDLGLGRTATSISVGHGSACAVLDTGTLKCWGSNLHGELGPEGVGQNFGDAQGELGDKLNPIPFGAGRTVLSVSQAGYHTCAVLDHGDAKCWGLGEGGQLGQDDALDHFDPSLIPAIKLGKPVLAISASIADTTCALLSDGSEKCWGLNNYGALSVFASADKNPGSSIIVGDYTGPNALDGEITLLPALAFGNGLGVKQIGVGFFANCALFTNNTVKCWGASFDGELGLGFGGGQQAGGDPSTLPGLEPLALGPGHSVTSIALGTFHSCALLDDGTVKCWGLNSHGQLGTADTANRGDKPGQMGTQLLAVPLGHKAVQISAGDAHTCALLDNGTIECWGYNLYGQLGNGKSTDLVVTASSTLTPVPLAF